LRIEKSEREDRTFLCIAEAISYGTADADENTAVEDLTKKTLGVFLRDVAAVYWAGG